LPNARTRGNMAKQEFASRPRVSMSETQKKEGVRVCACGGKGEKETFGPSLGISRISTFLETLLEGVKNVDEGPGCTILRLGELKKSGIIDTHSFPLTKKQKQTREQQEWPERGRFAAGGNERKNRGGGERSRGVISLERSSQLCVCWLAQQYSRERKSPMCADD